VPLPRALDDHAAVVLGRRFLAGVRPEAPTGQGRC
jgi:hypothetical protein